MMYVGIDHIVLACADPDAAARELEERVGLRSAGGGRHEALGTFNRLVWLGDLGGGRVAWFGQSMTRASSPTLIVPGWSTSPRTPKSAYLPSRRPR